MGNCAKSDRADQVSFSDNTKVLSKSTKDFEPMDSMTQDEIRKLLADTLCESEVTKTQA
jgi:hypothetical protein